MVYFKCKHSISFAQFFFNYARFFKKCAQSLFHAHVKISSLANQFVLGPVITGLDNHMLCDIIAKHWIEVAGPDRD